jgi:hypothetical protein
MGSQNKGGNVALRILASAAFAVAANILMSTSLSLGTGLATSLNLRKSGDPYFVHTIAFICIPPNLLSFGHCISFISVLADPEAIADGLNPFTINHIASTISFTAIGVTKMSSNPNPEISVNMSTIISTEPVNKNAAAINPQADINRGISFDLYNTE